MSHKVQVAAGLSNVQLPNGFAYSAGQQIILTDEEFAQIPSSMFVTVAITQVQIVNTSNQGITVAQGTITVPSEVITPPVDPITHLPLFEPVAVGQFVTNSGLSHTPLNGTFRVSEVVAPDLVRFLFPSTATETEIATTSDSGTAAFGPLIDLGYVGTSGAVTVQAAAVTPVGTLANNGLTIPALTSSYVQATDQAIATLAQANQTDIASIKTVVNNIIAAMSVAGGPMA